MIEDSSFRSPNMAPIEPHQIPSRANLRLKSKRDVNRDFAGSVEAGQMRFAPTAKERSIKQQLDSLTEHQRSTVGALRRSWAEKTKRDKEKKKKGVVFLDDQTLLRYARNSPGQPFDYSNAWNVMRRYRKDNAGRMLSLTAVDLEQQLQTKTLFPLPGLYTRAGDAVLYMKPARFHPRITPTDLVIDHLAYTMNCMLEDENTSKQGLCFLANMNDWTMEHYASNYCLKFMKMLQGQRLPVRVNAFLIVNPPKWFDKVWRMMKPMLTADFQKKVHMISECDLFEYLPFRYEQTLPDDLETGSVPTDALVQDFVSYRKFVEGKRSKQDAPLATKHARKCPRARKYCNLESIRTMECSDMALDLVNEESKS